MKILVIKPSSMGDVVHAFPAVRLLRRKFPKAHIAWVVNDMYADLVERCPDVDETVLFKRKRWGRPRYWFEAVSFVRELRQQHFDIAIDFQGLLRSSLIAFFSGARRRIGFRHAREGASLLYTEKVLEPANVKHALDKNVILVRSSFGISAALERPQLVSDPDEAHQAHLLLANGNHITGPILVVAPVSRWASKTWPPDFFVTVLNHLYRKAPDTLVWLAGTEQERTVGDYISANCQGGRPLNLMGKASFGVLIELLRQSHAILTNDSGPMHLAAALGLPVTALFGPTDPELTGPHGDGHTVFKGFCAEGPCFLKDCPFEEPGCWRNINATEVSECLVAYLQEKPTDA